MSLVSSPTNLTPVVNQVKDSQFVDLTNAAQYQAANTTTVIATAAQNTNGVIIWTLSAVLYGDGASAYEEAALLVDNGYVFRRRQWVSEGDFFAPAPIKVPAGVEVKIQAIGVEAFVYAWAEVL